MTAGVVILGASHAGVQCAAALRESGYLGSITLVDVQKDHPYQRPPLSKGFMTGAASAESLCLRGEVFFDAENIDLRLGVQVERIVRDEHKVLLSDGQELAYETLVIATGSRARPFLEDCSVENVYTLRTLRDAEAIRAAAATTEGPVVIVGGGYVGLELAATFRTHFQRIVHVVEAAPRLLMRAASPALSALVAARHQEAGTVVHAGRCVTGLEQVNGAVSGVVMQDGEVLPAGLVIKGVGILPNQELAAMAGLDCQDGILVDQYCRTSDSSIFAIGDCCRFPEAFSGRLVRLECVQNAHDQARTVASVISGKAQPYTAVPWFWSDQLGMKLQTAGRWEDGMTCAVRDESEKGKMSFFHFSYSGQLCAVETVNHPALHILSRRMILSGVFPEISQVENVDFDLKRLLA